MSDLTYFQTLIQILKEHEAICKSPTLISIASVDAIGQVLLSACGQPVKKTFLV